MKSLVAIALWGAMGACSSEDAAVGNVKIANVVASDCKGSVSKGDTRPAYYVDFLSKPTMLQLHMGGSNTLDAQLLDVMDNCAIGQMRVAASCADHRLVLVVYPDRDMATDCICMYDVGFSIENLLPGDYQLEVYHTTANQQTNASNQIYRGAISLVPNKTLVLPMGR